MYTAEQEVTGLVLIRTGHLVYKLIDVLVITGMTISCMRIPANTIHTVTESHDLYHRHTVRQYTQSTHSHLPLPKLLLLWLHRVATLPEHLLDHHQLCTHTHTHTHTFDR